MIIGISGVAGSGKDTAAHCLRKHGFQSISLADPLKRICREVYDFTEDQLWGPSPLRNTPDPRYIQSSREAHNLITRGSETHVWCTHCQEEFEREDQRRVRETPCVVYLTPRFALQLLGTEWGRRCYPNTWVDLAIRTARELLRSEGVVFGYLPSQGLFYNHPLQDSPPLERAKGVVIPDVRFRNEFDAIRAAGGFLIRIMRPGAGLTDSFSSGHPSETEQKEIRDSEFDAHLLNDGTLVDLDANIEKILETFQRQKS